MSRRKISQREARILKKRAEAAEQTLNRLFSRWATGSYPGVHIRNVVNLDPACVAVYETARSLGHGLVAVLDGTTLRIYAVARPKQ